MPIVNVLCSLIVIMRHPNLATLQVAAASSTLSDFIPTSVPHSDYTPLIPDTTPSWHKEPLNDVSPCVRQIMPHEHVVPHIVPNIVPKVNSVPFADVLAAAVQRSVLDGPPYVPQSEPLAVPHSEPLTVPHSEPLAVPHSEPLAVPHSEPLTVPHSEPLTAPLVVPLLPLSKLLVVKKSLAERAVIEDTRDVTRPRVLEDKRGSVVSLVEDASPYVGFLCSPRTQCDDLIVGQDLDTKPGR